jgi:hypothetical protein
MDGETREQQCIRGLRELADWLEAHPEAQQTASYGITLNHPCKDAEELVRLARSLGGRWDKNESSDCYFTLTRRFGPTVQYDLYVAREAVCTKRLVGTKTRTIEGPDPEDVAALPKVLQTVVEEEFEWDCPPSLVALAASETP